MCYSLATLSYAVALLSKPSATCVPLMALVIDWFFFRRSWKNSLPLMALWCGMAIALVVVTRNSPSGHADVQPIVGLASVCGVGCDWILFGEASSSDPAGDRLWESTASPGRERSVQWSWIPGLVFCVAIWLGPTIPGAVVPALLFLAGVAPVLGVVPFVFQNMSTVADRFVYVAMLGPALWLAQLLIRCPSVPERACAGLFSLCLQLSVSCKSGFGTMTSV